jgi:hypothetical protein
MLRIVIDRDRRSANRQRPSRNRQSSPSPALALGSKFGIRSWTPWVRLRSVRSIRPNRSLHHPSHPLHLRRKPPILYPARKPWDCQPSRLRACSARPIRHGSAAAEQRGNSVERRHYRIVTASNDVKLRLNAAKENTSGRRSGVFRAAAQVMSSSGIFSRKVFSANVGCP